MPKLLHWSETVGCGATIKLDNGDEVIVSIALLVRLQARKEDGYLKRLVGGMMGPKLYNEAIPYKHKDNGETATLNRLSLCERQGPRTGPIRAD